jgi:hypothetical protein
MPATPCPRPGETVSVIVRNDQGEEIYKETLPLSDLGTFNGQFTLAPEAGLGYYYIEVNYRKQTDGVGFQVAMYRRPEFQVTVTPDKDQVLAGDRINVTVQATYFFGGPVADAQVRWTLMTQDYGFRPDVPGWWDWTDTSRWDWWGPQEVPGYGRVARRRHRHHRRPGPLRLLRPRRHRRRPGEPAVHP